MWKVMAASVLLVGCSVGTPTADTTEKVEPTVQPKAVTVECPDGFEPWDNMEAWNLAASLVDADSSNPPVMVKRGTAEWPFAEFEAGMWTQQTCTFEGQTVRVVWLHEPYADEQPARAHEALHEMLFRATGDFDPNHEREEWNTLDAMTL